MNANTTLCNNDFLVIHPSTIMRQEDENKWLVFFPPTRGLHFIKNIGKEILDLCNGEQSVSSISEIISNKYNLELAETSNYILNFLNELFIRNVIIKKEE